MSEGAMEMNARMFALVFGIIYLLVGLLGFTASYTMADANLLGLFPVNVVHNLVHVAIGVWGLLSYRTWAGAVVYARGLAIVYLVLTILGIIPATNRLFGLVPLYGNDIWLHALTAIIAAYFGWMAPAETVETLDASRRRV
jgi:hypothetical protein